MESRAAHRAAAKRGEGGTRRAAGIAARAVAAIAGGYGLASLAAMALAAVLPLSRMDAVLTGMMTGLVVYAATAIWVFAASSALRAWAGLVAAALPFAALAMLGHWQMTGKVLP